MIECGEGFVTQLQRHLPPNMELKEQLTKIRVIWISHAHLDHYGGLPSLLRAITKGTFVEKYSDVLPTRDYGVIHHL